MSIIDPALAARVAAEGVPLSADLAEPKLRTLDQVEEELTGVSLSLYEEELDTARLRRALKSAQRGRRQLRELVRQMVDALNGHDCPPPGETPTQLVTRVSIAWSAAEARVAELEARTDGPDTLGAWLYQRFAVGHILPFEELGEADRSYWVHEAAAVRRAVARGGFKNPTPDGITRRIAPTQALREDRYDGPLHHTYRIPRDLPEIGGR